MNDFTRRGVLGAFLVAPIVGAAKIVLPKPPVEIDVPLNEFVGTFHICLLNEAGDEIVPLKPITQEKAHAMWKQDPNVTDRATHCRLYLPEEWRYPPELTVEHPLGVRPRLCDGDIFLEFNDKLVEFKE